MSHTRAVVVTSASTGLGSAWTRNFTQLKTQGDPDGKLLRAKVVNDMLAGLA